MTTLTARLAALAALGRALHWMADLDGCSYRFDTNYVAYRVSTGVDPATVGPFKHWYGYRDHGQTDEEFVATCHAGVDAGHIFWKGAPYEGAIEAWQRVADAGHQIHVVTDRGFGTADASQRATHHWLAEVGHPHHSVTFSRDKTVVPVDVAIEDRLENYDALDAAGVLVFLIDRDWNHVAGGDDRRRVSGVEEAVDLVLTALMSQDRSGSAGSRKS